MHIAPVASPTSRTTRSRHAASAPAGSRHATSSHAACRPLGSDPVAATAAPASSPAAADEDAVALLMAAIAAGDRPAIWALRELADCPVRSRVRGELRRLGVRYEAEDLDAMVTDAVLAIADIAASWRPGGAPPWSWAHHRVVGVVHRFVGTFADSFDALGDGDSGGALDWLAAHATRVAPSTGATRSVGEVPAGGEAVDPAAVVGDARAALRRLAATRPLAADLDAALSELASPRDAAVWLAMLDERAAGNRHPAVTVGARFAMRADAVRQATHRVWGRLARAADDGRFPALALLPPLAARRSGEG